jgi:hypothetical protein
MTQTMTPNSDHEPPIYTPNADWLHGRWYRTDQAPSRARVRLAGAPDQVLSC